MSFARFLKDKTVSILVEIVVLIFLFSLFTVTKTNAYLIFFVLISLIIAWAFCILFEYIRKAAFFKIVTKSLETLDKAYLLSEMLYCPSFIEGEILYDALKISNKSMNDQIAFYKLAMEEYREYIETWVHEIKTPIASSKLIIENNPSAETQSIGDELEKIDSFVEQALYYSRSNTVEKDYIIKELSLNELVSATIRKNSKVLIENKISVDIEELNLTVFSDRKWIDFILNQIISNSIKYKSSSPFIKFSAKENENCINLFIHDNGIGISNKDIGKVFDKGFTGENGRNFSKATGIGLYLCKKLCRKLGLEIFIHSDIGTTVEIIFPKGKLTSLN